MFKVITILLLLLVALHHVGNAQVPPGFPGTAPNVSVGEHSVWSVYPDVADFVLNLTEQRLLVSLFHGPDASDYESVHYVAHVGQVAPHVYRAEVTPQFWVEVNLLSGETFWYNSCITTCYRLPCPDYSFDGNN